MSRSPQPSRPPDKRPPKDQPPFPGPRKDKPSKPKSAVDPNNVLTDSEFEAAWALGTAENLPLTPHAESVLKTLLGSRERELAA